MITTAPVSLDALLCRKRECSDDLRLVERLIYEMESAYVDDTAHCGNIIRGWDSFSTAKASGVNHYASFPAAYVPAAGTAGSANMSGGLEAAVTANRSRQRMPDKERIFTNSSFTSAEQLRALAAAGVAANAAAPTE
jgi:hypothetical protein